MANESRLLKHRLAPGKNDEVRDALHTETSRQRRMRLGVDLEDDSFARHLLRRAGDLRSSRAARPAPRRPEVHQHRNFRVFHDLIEENGIGGQRLRNRSKRALARSATARVGKMRSRNTVPLVAMTASTNDWQDKPLG